MLVRFSSSTVIDCLIRWNEANKLVTRTNCWFANEFSQKLSEKTVFNGSKGKNSYFLSAERPLDGRHRWSGWMVDAWVSLHRTLLGTSINKVETILKRQYTHSTIQWNVGLPLSECRWREALLYSAKYNRECLWQ